MSDTTPEIFIYKMVVDNGGAPCVTSSLLSLAICKPKIRKSAGKGSLIFGFGGKKTYGERLIYIACVTDKLEKDGYYRHRKYARRPDCIYRNANDKAELKKRAKFHKGPGHLKRDVGSRFENAFVLLSTDFRYFGNKGVAEYKNNCPKLKILIEGLKQGHRNHLDPALRDELIKLKNDIWENNKRMKVGVPSDASSRLACNTDCPSASC